MSVTQDKKSRLALLAVLLLVTLAVYARTMNYGMVNWDDPLSGVQLYQETPELPGLAETLRPRAAATYQPVRALATALLAPYGATGNWVPYHVVSLLFFLGTVVMLYLVALRLFVIGRVCRQPAEAAPWAMLAAALFALHPSHAEVVAWVTGHKDTFVGFFYVGAIYFYIRRTRPSVTDTALCMLLYFLALGSKPSAVSLPLVLVAFDFLLRDDSGDRRRWYAGRVITYLLFFAPAIAAVIFFAGTTARVGELFSGVGEFPGKMVKFMAAFGFSAVKLLLPVNLCLRYPSFKIAADSPSLYLHVISGAAIIGWTARSVWRRVPYAFVLVWFTLALLPNANLIRIQIERADRYYYLSSAAFAVLAAFGALWLYRCLSERQRPLLRSLVVCSLLLLAVVSWKQAGYWSDPLSAWKRVYRLYPNMTLARLGLASGYLRSGEWDEALRLYKPLLEGGRPNTRAIKGAMYISERRGDRAQMAELARLGRMFAPGDDDFLASLVRYYLSEQDTTAAREVVNDWIDRMPASPQARLSQAVLLRMEGNDPSAERVYLGLIESHYYLPEPYTSLAEIKMEAGDFQQAEELLRRAIATGLRTADTRQQLAALHERTGRAQQALEIYSRYDIGQLKMSGLEFMGAHHFGAGELEQSLRYFQQMTARDSTLPRAWSNSAVVLQQLNRAKEADSFYRRAIGLDSAYVDAYFNRGNLLAELGRTAEAVMHYSRADSLVGGTDPAVLRSLADALAASGDTAAANLAVERLRELNAGGGRK